MSDQNKKPRRQSTFRMHGERGYTKLRNDFLQSPTLSHETMGLVAQMLSRSPEWQHTAAGIAATSASGIKKVWRMLAEAEEHGFIRRAQPRDFDGKFAVFDYLVSDEPAALIRAVAEEIDEIQRSSPHTQNGSAAPHTPLRCAAKRCTADGMQEKKESKKEIYEEKKISLSLAAQPTAAANERDAALDRFKKLKGQSSRWNPQTSFSAARAQFVQLPAEEQELNVEAAELYDRASKGCDHRVSLNRWLRGEGMAGEYRDQILKAKEQAKAHEEWLRNAETRRVAEEAEQYQRQIQNIENRLNEPHSNFINLLSGIWTGSTIWGSDAVVKFGPAPNQSGSILDREYPHIVQAARELNEKAA